MKKIRISFLAETWHDVSLHVRHAAVALVCGVCMLLPAGMSAQNGTQEMDYLQVDPGLFKFYFARALGKSNCLGETAESGINFLGMVNPDADVSIYVAHK